MNQISAFRAPKNPDIGPGLIMTERLTGCAIYVAESQTQIAMMHANASSIRFR